MKKPLVLLVCFLAFCFALSGAAQATSPIVFPGIEDYYGTGTCGENLTWLREQIGPGAIRLTIRGSGRMYDYDNSNLPPWWDYSTVIEEIVIEDGVTSIGDGAFDCLVHLNSITIPDSVTSIGNSAFSYCGQLYMINLPPALTTIGEYAFLGSGLQAIQIPDSVTRIGKGAFLRCELLGTVSLPAGITAIEDFTFDGCVYLNYIKIPQSVARIGRYAFSRCDSLKYIEIPANVVTIGEGAFGPGPQEVRYGGSRTMWSKIDFSNSNESLRNAAITYLQPDPSPVELNVSVVLNNQAKNKPDRILISSNVAFDNYGITLIGSGTDPAGKTEVSLPYPVTEIQTPVGRIPEDDNLVRNIIVSFKYDGKIYSKNATLTWEDRVELQAPDIDVVPTLSSEEDVNIRLYNGSGLPAGTELYVKRVKEYNGYVSSGYSSSELINEFRIPLSDFIDLEYPDEEAWVYGLGIGGWPSGHYQLTCCFVCDGTYGPEKIIAVEITGEGGRAERPTVTAASSIRAGQPLAVTFPNGIPQGTVVFYTIRDEKQNPVKSPSMGISNGFLDENRSIVIDSFGLDAGEYVIWLYASEDGKKHSDSEILYVTVTGTRPDVPQIDILKNHALINDSNSIRLTGDGLEDYYIVRYKDAAGSDWSYSWYRADINSGHVYFSETQESQSLVLNLGPVNKTDEPEAGTWYFTVRGRKNGCWSEESRTFCLSWWSRGPAPLPSVTVPDQLKAGEPLIILMNAPFPEDLYLSVNILDSEGQYIYSGGIYDYNVNSADSYPVPEYLKYEGLEEGSYQIVLRAYFGGFDPSDSYRFPLTVAGVYDPDPGNNDPDALDSGTCGENLTWTLSTEGVLTIRGTGPMHHYEAAAREAVILPPWTGHSSIIRSVVIESGVTSVGNCAFYGFPALGSVIMADSVESIGTEAFRDCTALTDIRFGAGLTGIGGNAFRRCSGLTSVTLPAGLKSIGETAFAECGLTVVNTEGEVKTMDFFYGSESGSHLYHIALPAAVEHVYSSAFYGNPLPYEDPDLVLPADLKTIEAEAFAGISAGFVRLPEELEAIGGGAFAGSSVRYVYVPQNCNCNNIAGDAFPKGTVILGYPEWLTGYSNAKEFAEENGYTFMGLEDPHFWED